MADDGNRHHHRGWGLVTSPSHSATTRAPGGTPARRVMLAAALLLPCLAALLLPGSAGAAPVPATPVAATSIAWAGCGASLECARVRVPLDWDRPREGTITLAVMRHLASRPDRRVGTVFFNPGGPGSSGVDTLRGNADLLDDAVRGRFDIVSWDPRGVGASTRVRCFADERSTTRFWGDLVVPSTRAGSERYARTAAAFARRCGALSGALLRHISTADTIRDLDHLRRLLGQERLNYIGWSYGTFLGQTYANVFPDRVRAMVLDAVVDAAVYVRGREASLENIVTPSGVVFARFQALCQEAGPERCALAGKGPVAARVSALLARLRSAPIPAPAANPPGVLTYGEALTALFPQLRNPGSWPDLARDLEAAANGDGSALATIARGSAPATGSEPAAVAIGCADSPARRPLRAWPQVIGRLGGVAGPVLGWWLWAPCAAWPAASAERYTGPWNAATTNPVLVIGTRFDPNTSYSNARTTARRLGNAVLLTHDGYGHISFVDPSRCVVRAIGDYLVHLRTPKRGTVCASNRRPFDPRFGEPLP